MRRHVLLAVAVMIGATSHAEAQSCQATSPSNCTLPNLATPATVTNPKTIRLTMSTTTTTGTTTIADFDNTYIAVTGPTATINANRSWTLLISAATATWANVGTGSRANKPAADLRWSTSVAGTFVGLTTTNATVASGVSTNSSVTSLFYRGVMNWTLDTPGVYTLGVTMTVTTP